MKTRDILNAKVLKVWTKGSLVVVGLFVVFYCSIAVFAVRSCTKVVDGKTVYYKVVDDKTDANKIICYKIVDDRTDCGKTVCYRIADDLTINDNIKCVKNDNGKIVCYEIVDENIIAGKTIRYKIIDDQTVCDKIMCYKTVNDQTGNDKITCYKTVDNKTVCYKVGNNKFKNNSIPLVLILVIPVIVFLTVFLVFSCLVKLHYKKLYKYSDEKLEQVNHKMEIKRELKMHKINANKEALIMVAKAINPGSADDEDACITEIIKETLKAHSIVENAKKSDSEKNCVELLKELKDIIEKCCNGVKEERIYSENNWNIFLKKMNDVTDIFSKFCSQNKRDRC